MQMEHDQAAIAMPDLALFSNRLVERMDKQGISPETAADYCRVTPAYIQSLMAQPKRLPGAKTLLKLAEMTLVTPDYLAGYVDDPKKTSPETPRPKDLRDFLQKSEMLFDGVPMDGEEKAQVDDVMNNLFLKYKRINRKRREKSAAAKASK